MKKSFRTKFMSVATLCLAMAAASFGTYTPSADAAIVPDAVAQTIASLPDGSWIFKAAADQNKPAVITYQGVNYYVFLKSGKQAFYLLDTVELLVPKKTSATLTVPPTCGAVASNLTRPQSLYLLPDGSYSIAISNCSTTALAGNFTIKLSDAKSYYFGRRFDKSGSWLRDTIEGLIPLAVTTQSYLLK